MALFACFEDHVNGLCQTLVRRRRAGQRWKQRRLWDTVDLDRMDFVRKVSLLLDKRGGDYKQAYDLYQIRCDIAHGSPIKVGAVNLPSQYRQIQALWRALSP